jgi:signal transduction histidine kinase
VLALVPLACALAALPMQSGAVGSLLVLATAAGSSMVLLRNFHRPPVPATLPPPPPPPAAPILPDAPTASLQPEAIAAAVRRALEQIDDLVAFSERRRVARTDLSTLNDTTLEFLQDLAEAALRSRAEFALAKIEFRLPVVLEACDLQSVEYGPATAEHFDIDGDPAQATTRRPALLAGGRCVKRGLAATRPGRAA